MLRLEGKVAFITGGGGGIGRATAERFAQEGAKVCIAEIDSTVGEKAAESARLKGQNSGGDAFFINTNVSDEKSVKSAISETLKHYGKIDILHNNGDNFT